MSFTPYEMLLFAGGFTIVGALIGNWTSHLLADIRNKKERIVTQYTAFKDSFIPTIQIINKTPKKEEDFIAFTTYFTAQEAAMLAFRNNLKGGTLSSFDEKWEEYQEHYKTCSDYASCVYHVCQNGHEIISVVNELLFIAGKKV